MQQPQQGCPGQFRVHRGQWYIPCDKTAQECTYCAWCVTNGCVELADGYNVQPDLANCLCDCPVKESHACLRPYDCGRHRGQFGGCAMGRCMACLRPASTPSTVQNYCLACSALLQICAQCGVAKTDHQAVPITFMMSGVNGRDSSDDCL